MIGAFVLFFAFICFFCVPSKWLHDIYCTWILHFNAFTHLITRLIYSFCTPFYFSYYIIGTSHTDLLTFRSLLLFLMVWVYAVPAFSLVTVCTSFHLFVCLFVGIYCLLCLCIVSVCIFLFYHVHSVNHMVDIYIFFFWCMDTSDFHSFNKIYLRHQMGSSSLIMIWWWDPTVYISSSVYSVLVTCLPLICALINVANDSAHSD